MHIMNMTAVSTAAKGTPAKARPIPPSSDCKSAVTTTPSATPRIACPASSTDCRPRSPASRWPKCWTMAAARSPPAYMAAAMTTVSSELHDDDAEPAQGADEPAGRAAGIGRGLARQLGDAAVGQALPQQDDLVAEQRNVVEPQRRRRQPERG